MSRSKSFVFGCVIVLASLFAQSQRVQAQSYEDRFHDLFVTAGYSTAFGAALGAAFLSFSPDPASQLRYVAIGASLGFIGGSVLGAYTVFAPLFVASQDPVGGTLLADNSSAPMDKGLVIRPTYSTTANRVTQWEAGLTVFKF